MPQEPRRPMILAQPAPARSRERAHGRMGAQASWTERLVLLAWILAIAVTLLWILLS